MMASVLAMTCSSSATRTLRLGGVAAVASVMRSVLEVGGVKKTAGRCAARPATYSSHTTMIRRAVRGCRAAAFHFGTEVRGPHRRASLWDGCVSNLEGCARHHTQ